MRAARYFSCASLSPYSPTVEPRLRGTSRPGATQLEGHFSAVPFFSPLYMTILKSSNGGTSLSGTWGTSFCPKPQFQPHKQGQIQILYMIFSVSPCIFCISLQMISGYHLKKSTDLPCQVGRFFLTHISFSFKLMLKHVTGS